MVNERYQPRTESEMRDFTYGLTHGKEILAPRDSKLQEIADKEIPYLNLSIERTGTQR